MGIYQKKSKPLNNGKGFETQIANRIKTISIFDKDVIKDNTLFSDTCVQITKEEEDRYNEYLRSLFRSYLTCNDNEFVDSVKNEKQK